MKKGVKARLLLLLIVPLLFFAILEAACRLLHLTDVLNTDFKFYIRQVDNDLRQVTYNREDVHLMWSPLSHYDDGTITVNAHGFNDRMYSVRKPEETFRILCLGDSSTFFGTYHALLEERLNESAPPGKSFEVINAGVTGYTSYQGLTLYRHKGARYNPDIVTFYFGTNDPVSNFSLSDREILERAPSGIKRLKSSMLFKLHLYRLLRKLIYRVIEVLDIPSGPTVPRVSIDDFRKNILELNALCARNGSRLILISPPLCKERAPERDITDEIIRYRGVLEKTAREHGIPILIVEEMTERSKLPTIRYFSDTVHPNEEGNRLLSERLYDYLTKRGFFL
jgi:lysophospholipase L1-like esterase